MNLRLPVAALDFAAIQQGRPRSVGQIILHLAVLAENRRNEQRIAQHVLAVEHIARRVIRELQHHRAHHRHAVFMRLHRLAVQVGHQAALELGELAADIHALLVKQPRHAVARRAVQAAVGGQEAKLHPALVNIRRRGGLKAGNIVAPVAEAAVAHGQTRAQRFRHRDVSRGVIAAPMHRELLTADRRAAGEQNRFPFALAILHNVKDDLVVQVGVIVVHIDRVAAVEPPDVAHRDALAEVGLEAVHAHVHQLIEVRSVPLAGIRIGEIDNRHARLPHIGLEEAAVGLFQQVAMLHAFLEQRRRLTDVRVNPAADVQPLLVVTLKHSHRVGERVMIPLEVAPVEALHPVAVEVEHGQRNVALRHAVDEGGSRLFVVIRGKRGGQPQTERPRGHERRATRQRGVQVERVLRRAAVNHVVDHRFALVRELDALHLFRRDFKGHVACVLHQHTVTAVGHVERDVLVRQLRRRAAIRVPHINRLTVLDVRAEAFAQTVNAFAHVQLEALGHVGRAVRQKRTGCAVLLQRTTHAAPTGRRQDAVADHIVHRPIAALADARGQVAGGEVGVVVILADFRCHVLFIRRKLRILARRAGKVRHLHADDVLARRSEHNVKRAAVENVAAVANRAAGADDVQLLVVLDDAHGLRGVGHHIVLPDDPVTLRKTHVDALLYDNIDGFFMRTGRGNR